MNTQAKESISRTRSFSIVTDNAISTLPKSFIWLQSRENISEWDTNHTVQWCNGWDPLPDSVGAQWKLKALDWRKPKHSTTQQMLFFPIFLKSNTALRYFWTITLVSAEQKVTLAQLQVYLFYFLVISFCSSRQNLIKHNVSSQKGTELLPLHSYTVYSHSPWLSDSSYQEAPYTASLIMLSLG